MNLAPTLSAPNIVLRPLVLSDAPALFIALSDPDVQRYRRDDAHADLEETRAYIVDTLRRSYAAWAITQDGGEALGRLALREFEIGTGEFGVVIRRTAQRRGLGSKAIALVERFAFDAADMTKLRADIDAENRPSLALFRQAGFKEEARIVAHRVTKLGLRDSIILEKRRSND